MSDDSHDGLVEDATPAARRRARLQRHVRWLRDGGVARLVEEDDLHPIARTRAALATRRWRRRHGLPAGSGRAVFLVGVQRSGTNMAVRSLERAPEVEVHNENDTALFERFQLRSDRGVVDTVAASQHEIVLFKPLCDSHRTAELLDLPGLATPPRAIWAFRDVDGRARSAVAKFGDVNRRVLAEIAAGGARDRWQVGGLDDDEIDFLAGFEPARLDAHAAAALFWLVRNRLLFRAGLAARDDVLAVAYGAMVADPAGEMERLTRFLGLTAKPSYWAHIEPRNVDARRLDLPARLRRECDELMERLVEESRRRSVPPDVQP